MRKSDIERMENENYGGVEIPQDTLREKSVV